MPPETTKVVPLTCHGHSRPVTHLSFSAVTDDDQYYLISACKDNNPMLRDGTTGDWIGTFIGHKGAVWQARLSTDAKLAATGSADFTAKVWDTHTGECLHTLQHNHIVRAVAFPTTPTATLLATGGAERKLRVFDLLHPSLNSTADTEVTPRLSNGFHGADGVPLSASSPTAAPPMSASFEVGKDVHQGTIKSIIFAPPSANQPNVFATAADDKAIRWFDLRADSRDAPVGLYQLDAPPGSCELSTGSAGHGELLTVAAGKTVHLFEPGAPFAPRNPEPVKTLKLPREAASVAVNLQARRFVAGGGGDTWVRVYDLDGETVSGATDGATEGGAEMGLEELEVGKGHHGPVWTSSFSPDGKVYATGSEDGTVKLWKFTEGAYGLWR